MQTIDNELTDPEAVAANIEGMRELPTQSLLLKRFILEKVIQQTSPDHPGLWRPKRQIEMINVALQGRDDLPPAQTIELKPGILFPKPQGVINA